MMSYLDATLFILVALAVMSYVSHNTTVTMAAVALIVIRLTPLNASFPWLQQHGMTVGIVVLTIAMLVPIASGKVSGQQIIYSFIEWKSLVAILVGILVSWLGMRGVNLMSANPSIVTGLIVGTLIGVAVFRGVPVGPLIAAGILSLVIGKSG